MERRTDWYAHPEYYEAIFGVDTKTELDFLEAVNARFGNGGKRWLEPACGAGRLLEEAARRGYRMTGYDLSPEMLAHAKARLKGPLRRRVRLHQGRMESFAPPALRHRFDFAFNLVATFRYLLTEKAALGHLRCVRRMLAPGGLYALGFHLTDYVRDTPESERWTGKAGADRVECHTSEGRPNRRTRTSPMKNRLRVRGPGRDWLIETEWKFRTYDARQFERLVEKAGMVVESTFTFDYRLDRPIASDDERLDRVYLLKAG